MADRMQLDADQARAFTRLLRAVREASDKHLTIPCHETPRLWDDPVKGSPAWCEGCPVISTCASYADSGAVREGIVAGRRIFLNAEQQHKYRTQGSQPARSAARR